MEKERQGTSCTQDCFGKQWENGLCPRWVEKVMVERAVRTVSLLSRPHWQVMSKSQLAF